MGVREEKIGGREERKWRGRCSERLLPHPTWKREREREREREKLKQEIMERERDCEERVKFV